MRDPQSAFKWLKRLFGNGRGDVLTLFTPEAARSRGPAVRIALACVTALGLAMAGSIGVIALAALVFAASIIYFLSTQVLGLQIDVDPRAFYERVQREAAAYGPN